MATDWRVDVGSNGLLVLAPDVDTADWIRGFADGTVSVPVTVEVVSTADAG